MKNVPLENLLAALAPAKGAQERQTLWSVIKAKVLAWILENEVAVVMGRVLAFLCFLFLAVGSYWFTDIPSLVAAASMWHDGFLVRVWIAAALVTWRAALWLGVVKLWGLVVAPWKGEAGNSPEIEEYEDFFHKSVKLGELTNFLGEKGHLNLREYCLAHPETKKNDLHEVAKALLLEGVMVKGGSDNRNVLDPDLKRGDVVAMLERAGGVIGIKRPVTVNIPPRLRLHEYQSETTEETA